MSASPPVSNFLTTMLLPELHRDCQAAQDRYRRTKDQQTDSSSCEEIVRRAATGDDEALALLLEISLPIVRRRCPFTLRGAVDDFQQEVAIRILCKFRHSDSPFQPGTFAAYLLYLQLTAYSIGQNMLTRTRSVESLDRLRDAGVEYEGLSPYDQLERAWRFDRYMELLPDPLMREVFRRRFVLAETPEAIVKALRIVKPDITKGNVSRHIERAIHRLSQLPEVREMLEAG